MMPSLRQKHLRVSLIVPASGQQYYQTSTYQRTGICFNNRRRDSRYSRRATSSESSLWDAIRSHNSSNTLELCSCQWSKEQRNRLPTYLLLQSSPLSSCVPNWCPVSNFLYASRCPVKSLSATPVASRRTEGSGDKTQNRNELKKPLLGVAPDRSSSSLAGERSRNCRMLHTISVVSWAPCTGTSPGLEFST